MIRNTFYILIILNFTHSLYGRGGPVWVSPNGKMHQVNLSEDEYRKSPGDNRTINIGDKLVIPAIVGSNYDTDLENINSYLYQFTIRKITRINSKRPKGTVISQSPKENILVAKPTAIDIVVSNGPKDEP